MILRAVLLSFVLAGCSDVPIARVLVYFDAETGATDGAETFRVTVFRIAPNPAEIDQLTYRIVDGTPGPEEVSFPFGITLEPLSDASTTYEVVGELFDATSGMPFSTQRARGQYVEDESLELRLVFDMACATAVCTENQTCQNGICYEPCVVPTAIGLLGERRSPAVTCPESPPCPDGDPVYCVEHGEGQGLHQCIDGVHVVAPCAGTCGGTPAACE